MSKRLRQYAGIAVAIICYYLIHEGAHALYALFMGVFKQVNFMAMGLGVQIEIYRELLTDAQVGWFCLVGPLATFLAGIILILMSPKICALKSALVKTCGWYTSIVILLLDPIYLSFVYRFVGGGDMNGIKFLIPEMGMVGIASLLLVINLFILVRVLLPKYKAAFN